jgi:glutathione synthase/RimK-type ligase-like ATP-grasp enzyme
MANVYVVVDDKQDWAPYYPSSNLLTFQEYIDLPTSEQKQAFVINLCRNYKYLSKGYYVSLLAEARQNKVIPSVTSINDLSRKSIYNLQVDDLNPIANKVFDKRQDQKADDFNLMVYFGRTNILEFEELAWKLFETFKFPILMVQFTKIKDWQIKTVRPASINHLKGLEEDEFAQALEAFDSKVWRKPRAKKKYDYDLAILVNPDEKMPPSNKAALKKLIKAAKEYSINAELITKRDLTRIGEYDALFIRETTAINHHTYTFARNAEKEGLVVIDSPSSILRCCNKVYLHELLQASKIKTPKTLLLDKDHKITEEIVESLGFPIVLKIPDSSFSAGVFLAKDMDELKKITNQLFERSVIILAQEYMYTDFDWRVGVLNKRPIFVCRYFMSKGHWQIYDHVDDNQIKSGGFEALAVSKAPKKVVKTALKATQAIGNGLYGVDLKEKDGEIYVIEVNDNPNIDSGVEDAFLGDDLYLKIMEEFYDLIDES